MTGPRTLAFAAAVALSLGCGGGAKSSATGQAPTAPTPPTPPAAGPPGPASVQFGTPGPWPAANATYGAKDGLEEPMVVAMTTDEAQDRWVATPRALYLLRPGDARFTRFDETAGLHLGDVTGRAPGPVGWAKYCDMRPIASDAPYVAFAAGHGPGVPNCTLAGPGGPSAGWVGGVGAWPAALDFVPPPQATESATAAAKASVRGSVIHPSMRRAGCTAAPHWAASRGPARKAAPRVERVERAAIWRGTGIPRG